MPHEPAASTDPNSSAQPETKEFERTSAKPWHDELASYNRRIETKWSNTRKNTNKLYARDKASEDADRDYALFWSNIDVLKSAVYARPPSPVVATRFKQTDVVATSAAELLERVLVTGFEQNDLHGCLEQVRDEYLRHGRGVARVRLGTRNQAERCEYDYFPSADFAHNGDARNWREVWWVGFRAWMTNEQLKKRFGDQLKALGQTAQNVPKKKRDDVEDDNEHQAAVWEIWNKRTGKVHFVAEEFEWQLDIQEPWLQLEGFWPCPQPAYSTVVPDTLMPVPDIKQYRGQLEEINDYTRRIAALSQALRVKGFYPSGAGEVSEAIEAAINTIDDRSIMVPVATGALLGGSGFKDTIVWLPIEIIVAVIKSLIEFRRVVIDDVYQIIGISDILRGETEASETATAQNIKSQWGSSRIRSRQTELQRFARDMARISAEITAENFSLQTLKDMSRIDLPSQQEKQQAIATIQMAAQAAQQPGAPGMGGAGQPAQPGAQAAPPAPPPPPEVVAVSKKASLEEVYQMLRDDRTRGFTIEIETDSTIMPDENVEKQRRMEFATAIGTIMKEAGPMVQAAPPLGIFVGEVLKFVAQGFRAGRPLMAAIEDLSDKLQQAADAAMQPQQPPPPSPEQLAAQAKLEATRAQTEGKMAATQMETQAKERETQMRMAEQAQKHEYKMSEQQMEQALEQMRADSEQRRLLQEERDNLMSDLLEPITYPPDEMEGKANGKG